MVAQVTSLTNRGASVALRNLNTNNASMTDAIAKVSTGRRITKASDDAAVFALHNTLSKELNGREQANRNAANGIAVVQVAAGGVEAITNAVNRLKTLAAMANSDGLSAADRSLADNEFQNVKNSISDIADHTRWSGTSLLEGDADNTTVSLGAAGSFSDLGTFSGIINGTVQNAAVAGTGTDTDVDVGAITVDIGGVTYSNTNAIADTEDTTVITMLDASGKSFQLTWNGTGSDTLAEVKSEFETYFADGGSVTHGNKNLSFQITDQEDDMVTVNLQGATAVLLGLGDDDITTKANAVTAQQNIDTALTTLNEIYAEIGANQRQFELILDNNTIIIENLESAKGTFMDADPAKSMIEYSRAELMSNLSRGMLQRANMLTASIRELTQ